MHDQPQSDDLLRVARRQLMDELLPALPAPHRYTALMIANAMGIASRAHALGGAAEDERSALLAQAGAGLGTSLDTAALSEALRKGRLDADLASLTSAIRADVISRVRIGNPKYLEAVQALFNN